MAAISALTVPSTLNLSLPKPHTTYQIQVSLVGSLQSYQVSRRFSQFVELDREITDVTGLKAPIPLPPKTLFSRPDVAQRQKALEQYLCGLLSHPSLCACLPLLHFLDISSVSTETNKHASAVAGAVSGGDYYDLLRTAKLALQRAKQALATVSSSTYPSDRAAFHTTLQTADRCLAQLERCIEHEREVLQDVEVLKRRDVVDALFRDLAALKASGLHLRAGGGGPSHTQPSPFAITGQGKQGASGGGGGRRLGQAPQETERTVGQSNAALLQSQTQVMADQETQLAGLLPLLQRQRELGLVIGKELDDQNAALDELADATDQVGGKIARGKKQITKITGKK
ncbi:Phox homologous domain-containing protein [Protomyces lactucae-debilis]|uniref:Phox homologous domain-containing protein n=1 Tax=Protomyces lactucae-debilis TaxID=2754530 RepID=A0A1Y2FF73_PROLT|nr:Phox homologous domain-containing protein [Protomyces lactucae-debilis]ORY82054.1 Phox homologous domain-containing protein [Protomyces lactucae-debilis]